MVDVICYSAFALLGIIWVFLMFIGNYEMGIDVIRLISAAIMTVIGIVKIHLDVWAGSTFEWAIVITTVGAMATVIAMFDVVDDR